MASTRENLETAFAGESQAYQLTGAFWIEPSGDRRIT